MSRKNKDLREAAAETTHTAADRGAAILEQVLDALNPLLETATEKVEEVRKQAAPYTETAKDRIAPTKDRMSPLADTAKERIAPLADTARQRAETARKTVAPLAATAAAGVAAKAKDQLEPTVDQARQKVQDELVPQLLDLLHQAENHPAVSEATKRSTAAAAALRGDLSLPEKKKRSAGGTIARVAAAGAVLAAAAVAVRQFLATKDDAWTAHQPSTAYQPSEAGAGAGPSAEATWVKADDAKLDAAETEATRLDVVSEPDPEERMGAEGGPAHSEALAEDLNILNEYGEGSYVGDEPPAGYTIKGNERSMKFHTADSAGYDRTIADVYFSSVEAAEKAGFTRAQR
ncbi:hypothetical protein [Luteococcus peritonei]|uniref:Uncharacterized protein n=1 Tax=Luteococcus peritonei TaxID=88874 RepID=A0ABW4RRZ0_9ACTN